MTGETQHDSIAEAHLRSNPLHHTTQAHPNNMVDPWWMDQVLIRGYDEFLYHQWAIESAEVEPELIDAVLPDGVRLVRRGAFLTTGKVECVVESDDSIAAIELGRSTIWVGVAGSDLVRTRRLLGAVTDAFPEVHANPVEPRVTIGVWGRDDGHRSFRTLEVEAWEASQVNYASRTRDVIAPLMSEGFAPDGRGKLLVWAGPPGTGKSFAIGSLAYAWREWAQFCFIADPATFLHDPDSLMEFMFGRPPLDGRWRVGVLEDTGELFGSDGRGQTDQTLRPLLNATDGILAQNSKTMFVITTNQPMERFHDAVIRPGRCASRVSFEPLSVDSAREWLLARDRAEVAKSLSQPTTIAELFAMADGLIEPGRASASVGMYL